MRRSDLRDTGGALGLLTAEYTSPDSCGDTSSVSSFSSSSCPPERTAGLAQGVDSLPFSSYSSSCPLVYRAGLACGVECLPPPPPSSSFSSHPLEHNAEAEASSCAKTSSLFFFDFFMSSLT